MCLPSSRLVNLNWIHHWKCSFLVCVCVCVKVCLPSLIGGLRSRQNFFFYTGNIQIWSKRTFTTMISQNGNFPILVNVLAVSQAFELILRREEEGVLYLFLVSNENVSSRLSTDWLTGSVQTSPEPPEWKTASTRTESETHYLHCIYKKKGQENTIKSTSFKSSAIIPGWVVLSRFECLTCRSTVTGCEFTLLSQLWNWCSSLSSTESASHCVSVSRWTAGGSAACSPENYRQTEEERWLAITNSDHMSERHTPAPPALLRLAHQVHSLKYST